MGSIGYGMTRRLADKVFAQAGVSWDEVGVIELHDCFAANELITYSTLGLCAIEDTHHFVERGDNTYGGKYVINPSGGLEAKGHPLGATGLAMHFSITSTIPQGPGLCRLPVCSTTHRGSMALYINIGLGGAVVISLLRRPEFYRAGGPDGRD
ncbi:thiolase-like protein, partial [Lactifluus subvellereus]